MDVNGNRGEALKGFSLAQMGRIATVVKGLPVADGKAQHRTPPQMTTIQTILARYLDFAT
jgi:hypothetical protein